MGALGTNILIRINKIVAQELNIAQWSQRRRFLYFKFFTKNFTKNLLKKRRQSGLIWTRYSLYCVFKHNTSI